MKLWIKYTFPTIFSKLRKKRRRYIHLHDTFHIQTVAHTQEWLITFPNDTHTDIKTVCAELR